MITFPKYEAYQDSGISWLGEVPAHWDLKKNKFLLTEKKTTVGKESADFTLLSLTLNGVIARDMENPQGKFPAEFNTYKIVDPNDLVFCLFDVEETPRTVGRANQRGMITGAYTVFECSEEVDSRFFYYYYLSLDFDKRLRPLYTGLRNVIKADAFLGTKSPIPPLEEQKRIVEFLDRKTAEIDEAIAHKQRLIELLQEQKAILINQAVTQGLNPNAPMRDSGIDWLTSIPEHWKTRRAKVLFKQSRLPVRKDDGVVTSYRDGEVTLRTNRRTEGYTVAILEQGYQGVRVGQLVINSMDAFAGAIGVSDSNGKCSPEYVVCDPVDPELVEPKYYALLLREMALKGYIEVICPAVRQRGLRIRYNSFAQLLLPLPPRQEQKEIVQQVDEIIGESQKAFTHWEKEIDLIKEYKSILISKTVTGKIKV